MDSGLINGDIVSGAEHKGNDIAKVNKKGELKLFSSGRSNPKGEYLQRLGENFENWLQQKTTFNSARGKRERRLGERLNK